MRAPFPLFPLLVLAGAIFVSISSEFLPIGILPNIAHDLRVSESRVGLLITIFAFTVVLSATPLTALTTRFSRKPLLIATLLVFAVANLLAAVAPTYEFLVAVRILAGLSHGVFWSVAGPYGARLVSPGQLTRAVSITNGGGVAALILGVPFGTAIGHALGWRLAFVTMAVIIVAFTALVLFFLPDVEHRVALTTAEIDIPAHRDRTLPAVIVACLLVTIVILGQNTFSTYLAPWLITIARMDPATVSGMFLIWGGCAAVGLVMAGAFGDRYPRAAIWTLLFLTVGFFVAMSVIRSPQWLLIAVFVGWGISFGGVPSFLQGRVLSVASHRVRDVSSAVLTTAFNIAIGGGALLGGILFDHFGVGVLPLAGAVLTTLGLAFVIVTDLRRRVALR